MHEKKKAINDSTDSFSVTYYFLIINTCTHRAQILGIEFTNRKNDRGDLYACICIRKLEPETAKQAHYTSSFKNILRHVRIQIL